MSDPHGDSGGTGRFCGTLAGDGRPGPIEERIGRRLVRLVDPQSEEGARLLEAGRVELLGPEGDSLGRIPLREAYRELLERLERRIAEAQPSSPPHELEAGLDRLKEWSSRMLREPR